jgi:hypothetical protein
MNSQFASLLEKAGVDTSERGFWKHVVIVNNYGPLPARRLNGGGVAQTEGFNAVVLDRHGLPTHFCKCRPPTTWWIRQTEMCARLSREPALRQMIPSSWAVSAPDIHMSISTYVPGRLFDSMVSGMPAAGLGVALREILEAVETIAMHYAIAEPDVFSGQTHIDLAAEAEWAFDAIPPSRLAPAQASAVRQAIASAGAVRRVLQHGDLWPRNILRFDGCWNLLDFDGFGRIQAPLYDAFHLVRLCWALRQRRRRVLEWVRARATLRNRPATWVDSLRSPGATEAYQRTLGWARVRHGLSQQAATGTLAFYLINVVARMCRRQLPMPYVEPVLGDLVAFAECLCAGETFADAFA